MIQSLNSYINKIKNAKARLQRQQYLSSDFPSYHLDILESIEKLYGLKGKMVIDIGGSNIPAEVMHLFGVKKFVCFDPVSKWTSFLNATASLEWHGKKIFKFGEFNEAIANEYSFIIDDDIENVEQEMNGIFDVAISISTFEHVTSLEKTLSVIYSILKPQGILYSQYEPVFSCAAGHHVYINSNLNFNNMPEIDHMHLLYSREEAESFLNRIDRFDSDNIKAIINQAYDSSIINRFTLDEHINAFQNAKFNKYQITYFFTQPVPKDRLEILYKKFGHMRYDVRGIQYIASKE